MGTTLPTSSTISGPQKVIYVIHFMKAVHHNFMSVTKALVC